MTRAIEVLSAGPGVTVQDMGRPGYLAEGLSRGGAADRLALAEGAALLGQPEACAALEMAGFGGRFRATADLRIALTGAPMAADLEGVPLRWNASHRMPAGQVLTLGGVQAGVYGYLHLGGGLAVPEVLGSRSAHLTGGLGRALAAGDVLPVGPEAAGLSVGLCLPVTDRSAGGMLRLLPGPQTALFTEDERARFAATRFTRDARGNRQGVRLNPDGAGFAATGGLTVLSEVIVPGDVQVTGDGAPYVLMPECQTTGGYPRIGTVHPDDLPLVAQAAPGTHLQFRLVTLDEARTAHARERAARAGLARAVQPIVRDPRDMSNLLSYQLIGGVTAGDDDET
jgi:allophanate hydrolase